MFQPIISGTIPCGTHVYIQVGRRSVCNFKFNFSTSALMSLKRLKKVIEMILKFRV